MNSYLVWGNQRDGPRPRPQFPRDLAAADGGRQRLAAPLLDDRTPRHQAELPPRLPHRVASAGQLHAAAVDAGGCWVRPVSGARVVARAAPPGTPAPVLQT